MEKQEKVEQGFSVPREIIFQILKELPVKCLLRLRCVSKLWCSIIDDPFFVHSHYIRSHSRPGGINIILGSDFHKLYSADPEGHEPHRILNTEGRMIWRNPHQVNGLIRMDDWIWNPSTRECVDIPPLSVTVTLHCRLKLYPEYFLGYDPSTMKYKIFGRCHITTKRDYPKVDGRIEYKILTLGTNSWRDIVDGSITQQLNVNEFECDGSTCYIDGVIYCLNSLRRYPDESSGDEQDENVILAFELGPEKFGVMSLPPGNKYGSLLLQVGENLAVMDEKLTTIWILEDYEKQLWNKESVVMMYEGKPLIDDDVTRKIPIGTVHTGEILLLLFANKFKTPKLFYYDLESKKVRMVKLSKENAPFLCIKHVESIFRLTGIEGGEHILIEEEIEGGQPILIEEEIEPLTSQGQPILIEEEIEPLTSLWEVGAGTARPLTNPLESWDAWE